MLRNDFLQIQPQQIVLKNAFWYHALEKVVNCCNIVSSQPQRYLLFKDGPRRGGTAVTDLNMVCNNV